VRGFDLRAVALEEAGNRSRDGRRRADLKITSVVRKPGEGAHVTNRNVGLRGQNA
jgi:hypothetical protein